MKRWELFEKARRIILGGTQLLSKRASMFLSQQWWSDYASARGTEVTDLDARTYIDMSMIMVGIGACVLGYADADVDRAVKSAIGKGVVSTLGARAE